MEVKEWSSGRVSENYRCVFKLDVFVTISRKQLLDYNGRIMNKCYQELEKIIFQIQGNIISSDAITFES